MTQWANDLRHSADLGLSRRLRGIVRDTKHYALRELTIRKYLAEHDVPKLQIGTGSNHLDGWLNTDIMPHSRDTAYLDVRRTFPFVDGTFEYVFTEHVIEHVPFQDGRHMLREIFRCLRPGGWLRVVTPDLAQLIGLYAPEKTELQEKYIRFITDNFLPDLNKYRDVFVINECVRFSGHHFIYDAKTLEETLREMGFAEVRRCDPDRSELSIFDGLDSHGDYIGDDDINRFESMVFEARRPG